MLKQQVQNDLKQAMLAKDEVKKSVLRMLLQGITYYEINKGGAGYEATDEDVLSVINTQVKQRRDSITQFENGGRQDLADKEKAELPVLLTFLPQQMSEEEIREVVKNTVTEVGATSPTDMGKVMSALMPKVKGKADGSLVSKLVKEALR